MPLCKTLAGEIRNLIGNRYLFGSEQLLESFLCAFLVRGHVLIEGPPGTAKTMAAKLFAATLSKSFRRIQFTSDMLPADIIGSHVYAPGEQAFKFIPGPLFADFILADEVNRTPPRTQSALLEAMEERQVTVEGKTFGLSSDFFVVATQNPHELEGTFPLPEAQLDRFLFKVVLTHAPVSVETQVLAGILSGTLPPPFADIAPLVIDRAAVDAELQSIHVEPALLDYVARLLQATRSHPLLLQGASVRGGIALVKSARARAACSGRPAVLPDDIKSLAVPCLRHRIRLSPEAQLSNANEESVLTDLLAQISFPV